VNSCTITSGGNASVCGCVADKLARRIPVSQVDSLAAADPRVTGALHACGASTAGRSGSSTGAWPPQVRANFVNACTATSGGKATLCGCVADKLAAEIPASQVDSLAADDPRVRQALQACGA
jgi:hypothetical protein